MRNNKTESWPLTKNNGSLKKKKKKGSILKYWIQQPPI